MKHTAFLTLAATLLLVSCNNSGDNKSTNSDSTGTNKSEVKKDEPWVPIDSATMGKAMMDYAKVGKMQEMLASWNGTWNTESTMWMSEGDAPVKATGTSVNSMILGGRYQSGKNTGNMMGMPFEGVSTVGYDNAAKQFISTWIDNMGTGMMIMKGPWDESTKTMTLSGTMTDICRPGKECSFKEVFTVIDDNTQKMVMWGPDPKTGKEYKMMELTFTRKK